MVATPKPCVVPPAPEPPELNPFVCGESGEYVCLTVDDTKKLVAWAAGMEEVERAIEACAPSQVKREP